LSGFIYSVLLSPFPFLFPFTVILSSGGDMRFFTKASSSFYVFRDYFNRTVCGALETKNIIIDVNEKRSEQDLLDKE
jgi:hypothetical protein